VATLHRARIRKGWKVEIVLLVNHVNQCALDISAQVFASSSVTGEVQDYDTVPVELIPLVPDRLIAKAKIDVLFLFKDGAERAYAYSLAAAAKLDLWYLNGHDISADEIEFVLSFPGEVHVCVAKVEVRDNFDKWLDTRHSDDKDFEYYDG
jgi:hypothetical protein